MKRQRSYNAKNYQSYKRQRRAPIYKNRPFQKRDVEYKATDQASQAAVSNAGTIVNLTGNLVRGDSFLNNFQGAKIVPIGIQFKWFMIGSQSNIALPADNTNGMRIIVFQWFDTTPPGLSNILENTTYIQNSAIQINSRDKIRVLMDTSRTTYVSAFDSADNTVSTCFSGKKYIKGSRMQPIYFQATNDAAISGNIYCLLISDSSVIPHPGIAFYSRITFVDT